MKPPQQRPIQFWGEGGHRGLRPRSSMPYILLLLLAFFSCHFFFQQIVSLMLLPFLLLLKKFELHNDFLIVLLAKKLVMDIVGESRIALGPYNIWKINICLLLKIGAVISCTHCELCDHFHGNFLHEISSTIYPSIFWRKKIYTLLSKLC